jgi:hypothetical protein
MVATVAFDDALLFHALNARGDSRLLLADLLADLGVGVAGILLQQIENVFIQLVERTP